MGLLRAHVRYGGGRRGAGLTRKRQTVTVHGAAEARAALEDARAGGCDITLISAPGAAASGGPGWFMALVECAARDYPDLKIDSVLDCGDRPGDALAALRAGWKTIVYTGPASAKIDDIAAQCDATVLRRRP